MKWLAVKAQFIRKSPVNWVLTSLCWGSGTHGLGIQELQCDACQIFELWQAGVAGMGRAAQPPAGTSGRAPRRFTASIVLARLIPLTGMLVWCFLPIPDCLAHLLGFSQFKNTCLGLNLCCFRAQRPGWP